MDITPVLVAVIFCAAGIWALYRALRPQKAAVIEKLAQSAVMLAQDKKNAGMLEGGLAALDFAASWIVKSARENGYEVRLDEAIDMARIAYQAIYKAGK